MAVLNTVTEVLERLSVQNKRKILFVQDASCSLEKICSSIDSLISEFDGESYEATIFPETLSLVLSFDVPEMVIEDCVEHPFFDLINNVDVFSFCTYDDNIRMSVRVDNLFHYTK